VEAKMGLNAFFHFSKTDRLSIQAKLSVSAPVGDRLPPVFSGDLGRKRSQKGIDVRAIKSLEHKVTSAMQAMDHFTVDFDFGSLENIPLGTLSKAYFHSLGTRIQQTTPLQDCCTGFYSKDGRPLAFYFGKYIKNKITGVRGRFPHWQCLLVHVQGQKESFLGQYRKERTAEYFDSLPKEEVGYAGLTVSLFTEPGSFSPSFLGGYAKVVLDGSSGYGPSQQASCARR
jgi:hypothetical protein